MDGITYDNGVVGRNDRAYVRKIIRLYQETLNKLKGDSAAELYNLLEQSDCLSQHTASKDKIKANDEAFRKLYNKTFRPKPLVRYVDFNQGIEGKRLLDKKMSKLSEINVRPLRIAFDCLSQEKSYRESIKTAAKHGITNFSNYMLYNHKDKPTDLYIRMKLTIDLCDKHNVNIYSFPMKYHPVADPRYFRNRNYLGKHWNRKFIRAIQAVLNSTKGKIGKGKSFFEEAFGENLDEFEKILWMPETFIIYRRKYDANLRERLTERYGKNIEGECNFANEWWDKWRNLSDDNLEKAKEVIKDNIFTETTCKTGSAVVDEVLVYYMIQRD
jgi:hypothetical protein